MTLAPGLGGDLARRFSIEESDSRRAPRLADAEREANALFWVVALLDWR